MRIKLGGVIATGATGRFASDVGGFVIGSNGVVRNYVTPVNPQTSSQGENRNAFRFLTQAWIGLTEAKRVGWEDARTSGEYKIQDVFTGVSRPYASAKDLFIALNINGLIAGGSIASPSVVFAEVPANTALPAIGLGDVIVDVSANTVMVDYGGTLGTSIVLVRMTPVVSSGNMRLTSVKSKLRSLAATGGAGPIDVSAEYHDVYPAAFVTGQAGMKIGYTVEQIEPSNGKRGLIGTGFTILVS